MAVLTNRTAIYYSLQPGFGQTGTPDWKLIEPNTIPAAGPSVTSIARTVISPRRSGRAGQTSDLDSAPQVTFDVTYDGFIDFLPGAIFSNIKQQPGFIPTAVASGGYTVASGGDLTQRTLVYARKYRNSGNNGVKEVGSGSTTTNIAVTGLTAETNPPLAARVDVVGVRGATGDIEIDSNGDIISTTLDFTTLGLFVGQSIFIGGEATVNQFSTANNKGLAVITAISANVIELERRQAAFSADDGATKQIDLYFGSWIRDVVQTDADFLFQHYLLEVGLTGFTTGATTQYMYPIDNIVNTFNINIPLTDRATVDLSFIGSDTPQPTSTQMAGDRTEPTRNTLFNSSSNFRRLSLATLDETGITSFFNNLTININNNGGAKKAVANLGAVFMTYGLQQITGTASVIFTDSAVLAAVRNNTAVSMDFGFGNEDGFFHVDFPSMRLGNGALTFNENDVVDVALDQTMDADNAFGHQVAVTMYPFLPNI